MFLTNHSLVFRRGYQKGRRSPPEPELLNLLLLDGFDPLLLLLRRGRRYSVNHVVALDDAPICLRLAGFDDLAFVVGVVKLEAVLDRGERAGHGHIIVRRGLNTHAGKRADTHGLPGLLHLPDAEILQRDDPTRLLVLEEGRTGTMTTAGKQCEGEETRERSFGSILPLRHPRRSIKAITWSSRAGGRAE